MACSGPQRPSVSPPCVIRLREGRTKISDGGDISSRFSPPTSPRNSLKKRAGILASNIAKNAGGMNSPRNSKSPPCTPRSLADASGKRCDATRSDEEPTDRKVDRALESTEELLSRFRELSIFQNEIDLSDIDSTAERSRMSTTPIEDISPRISEGIDFRSGVDPDLAGLLENIGEVNRLIKDLALFGDQFNDQHLDSVAQDEVDAIEGRERSSVARSLAHWPLIKELAILGQKIRDFEGAGALIPDSPTALSISRDLALLKDKLRSLSNGNHTLPSAVPPLAIVEKEGLELKAKTLAAHARQISEGSQTLPYFSPKSCVIASGSVDRSIRSQSPYRELDPKALTEIVPQVPTWTSVHTSYGYATDTLVSSKRSSAMAPEDLSATQTIQTVPTVTQQLQPPRVVATPASLCLPARNSLPSQRAGTIAAPMRPRLVNKPEGAAPDLWPWITPPEAHSRIPSPISPPVSRRATFGGALRTPQSPLLTAEANFRGGVPLTAGGSLRTPQSPLLTAEATFRGGVPLTAEAVFRGSPPAIAEPSLAGIGSPGLKGPSAPVNRRHTLGSTWSSARSATATSALSGSAAAPVLPMSRVQAPAANVPGTASVVVHSSLGPRPAPFPVTPGLPVRRTRTISPPSRQAGGLQLLDRTPPSVIPPGIFTPGTVYQTLGSSQRARSREESPGVRVTPAIQAPAPPATVIQTRGEAAAPPGAVIHTRAEASPPPAAVIQTRSGPEGMETACSSLCATTRSMMPGMNPGVQAPAVVRRASAPTPAVVRRASAPTPAVVQADSPTALGAVDADSPNSTKYVWEAVHTTTYRLKAVG